MVRSWQPFRNKSSYCLLLLMKNNILEASARKLESQYRVIGLPSDKGEKLTVKNFERWKVY